MQPAYLQNLGPHMLQKWAVLAGSWGRVASWNRRAVTGSKDRLNWSYHLKQCHGCSQDPKPPGKIRPTCCIAKHDSSRWGCHASSMRIVYAATMPASGEGSAVMGMSDAGKEQYLTIVGFDYMSQVCNPRT